MAVMTAQEFINKALEILNYNTTYVFGGKGILLSTNPEENRYLWSYTDSNNRRYNTFHPIWNKIVERCKDYPCFGFDCSGLVSAILNGWNYNDAINKVNFANGPYTSGADSFQNLGQKSTDFSTILPGELIHRPGHIGIYIGLGLIIESTSNFENNDGCKTLLSKATDISGYLDGEKWASERGLEITGSRTNWDYHIKLNCIDYNNAQNIQLTKLSEPLWGLDFCENSISVQMLKDDGYKFLIHRGGITSQRVSDNRSMRIDNKFETRYKEAKSLGFLFGTYWFSCATDRAGGEREANFFYEQALKGKSFDFPIFIDVEDEQYQRNCSEDQLAEAIRGFCDTIQSKPEHFLAGIYIGRHFPADGFLKRQNLTDYFIWLPSYPNNHHEPYYGTNDVFNLYYNTYNINPIYGNSNKDKKIIMWQYTQDLPYKNSQIDQDYCYYNFPEYIKYNNFNNYSSNLTITEKQYKICYADDWNNPLFTFFNYSDAITYVNDNSNNNTKLYIYNEENNLIYPYNAGMYSVGFSESNTKKYIELEPAKSAAQAEASRYLQDCFVFYTSTKQVIYLVGSNNLYVLREKNNYYDEKTQKYYSTSLDVIQDIWIEYQNDSSTKDKYGIYEIKQYDIQPKLIIPYTKPYQVINNLKNKQEDYADYNEAKKACNLSGYPAFVYDLNYKTELYSIDLGHYNIYDVIGITDDKNKIQGYNSSYYLIQSIENDTLTIQPCSLEGIVLENTTQVQIDKKYTYPISLQIPGGGSEFYVNTGLIYELNSNLEKANNFQLIFGDIVTITNIEEKNNTVYCKTNKETYINYNYLTKIIESE